jgi:hypothetical protein
MVNTNIIQQLLEDAIEESANWPHRKFNKSVYIVRQVLEIAKLKYKATLNEREVIAELAKIYDIDNGRRKGAIT